MGMPETLAAFARQPLVVLGAKRKKTASTSERNCLCAKLPALADAKSAIDQAMDEIRGAVPGHNEVLDKSAKVTEGIGQQRVTRLAMSLGARCVGMVKGEIRIKNVPP